MPKLSLSRDHALEPAVLRDRVAAMEDKLRTKYRADTRWENERTMRVTGPGVDGTLRIEPKTVQIDLKLGLMLTPLRGQIEAGLSRALDKVVNPEPA